MTSGKPGLERPGHDPLRIFIIVATVVVYAAMITINYLSNVPALRGTIFLNSTGEVSSRYFLEITPAGWTIVAVWMTIYVWNAMAMIYGLTTICRRRSYDDQYMYAYGTSTPPLMYVFYCLNLCCNVAWIFMWDRQHIIVAFILLVCASGSLYVAITLTLRATFNNTKICCSERWCVIGLVHNSMFFYATWVSVATLLNFGHVLSYAGGNVPQSTTCTVILSILTAGLLTWFVSEMVLLDKFVRYVFTPYIVLIIAFCGSIDKNWNTANTNSIFTACLLGIVSAMLLVKIAVSTWRHIKNLTSRSASEGDSA